MIRAMSTQDSIPALTADDHLILVDGSTFIFRAYHALPPLTRKPDGLPVGAVSGFCNMLWKLLQEGLTPEEGDEPTHFAVIFDHSSKTFRNTIYPEYKANRPDPPEDLVPQFGLIREATRAFSVPCVEQEGFEADDLIATYARQAAEQGAKVTIVSGDKDLMQLIGPKVGMIDTMKNKVFGEPEVFEKFGVGPDKVIEVQSLAGDSVDNVPGVPGIGLKTAALLINEFGDLETLLAQAETIKQNKRRENLIEFADQARVSRELVTLKQDVPVEIPVASLTVTDVDGAKAVGFLKAMGFSTLTKRVAEETGAEVDAVEPADFQVPGWDVPDHKGRMAERTETASGAAAAAGEGAGTEGMMVPQTVAEARAETIRAIAIDSSAYETVTSVERLQEWCDAAIEKGYVAFDTETTSLDAMQADLVGLSLSTEPGQACYVPLAHVDGEGDLLGGGGLLADQIPLKDAMEVLKPMLEDRSVLKIAQNLKYDWLVMTRYGIDIAPYDDTMLLSYTVDAGKGGNGMDELSERWLGHKPIPFKEVCGSGKSMITFDKVAIDKATAYAAEDADVTLRLWQILKPRLASDHMATVYETLERPMVPVLARMEKRGISVDRQMLSRLSGDFAQGMAGLESEIYELAGETFNIGSPKQLGEILFGKMGIPGGKKTKTGAWSTSAQVLEDLAAEGHELPSKIVAWRQLSKLKSTYSDALPGYINPETGRVHTSYALAATTTGRLSSSEPNLQNIPVRTEAGRKIRQAFIAEKGHKLVSADYSQIELRVLAHMADIPQLKKAFEDGLDIHAMTASEMFGTPIEGMDPMVRRQAKAINFGIIYGISAFGLANQLGISRGEAGDYIKTYFERFPGIKDYMETIKKQVHADGFVTTIFGRKAHYPEVNTKNPNHRAFYERAAINAPIQGSAADILRRAMVRMEERLSDAKLDAQMLLQVHDELIFEVPDAQVDATLPVIRDVMENACDPALKLTVPLQVDARAAGNWDEAH
ncbi:DNA polymerase I [Roseibium album]|uniref:DNA polymerase I n=1 Tax=Roseibium album TaxID=311410 RepID=A0A0M7A0F2_9HYPH|nr:DNA polymerase I [Roseibium album]CTQ58746.1 DNA polymerase I [Roseibium album]CTQ67303.1 DNA polymerase I [Roseibium album]CTQ72490.1 DNA polymerase I [Roseibium album]